MNGTGIYRLTRKLLALCILLSCLFVLTRDEAVKASASCDTVYFSCTPKNFNSGGPCEMDYTYCLQHSAHSYLINNNDECQSEKIYNNCVRGIFPNSTYRQDFLLCVSDGNASEDCCAITKNIYESEYCY
ncbi:MAG: hypothetical protein ABW250_08550 [Pyrinomonadaceae bacterium]